MSPKIFSIFLWIGSFMCSINSQINFVVKNSHHCLETTFSTFKIAKTYLGNIHKLKNFLEWSFPFNWKMAKLLKQCYRIFLIEHENECFGLCLLIIFTLFCATIPIKVTSTRLNFQWLIQIRNAIKYGF